MEKSENTFHFNQPFNLEAGGSLTSFQLRYTTLGQINARRDNVVWVCHALTGNSDFTAWWTELFSEGSAFDPSQYFIIGANMLGGCYGSTGPLSTNPDTGKPFYHTFPTITNRDVVRAFDLLRVHLKIEKVHSLIGGSLGGQQVLEWAIEQPDAFRHIIPIACNAWHSPWGIAFNEAQRLAIEADPTWKESDPRAGSEGLKAARAIGMISYRQYEIFLHAQSEKSEEKIDGFRAASYQRYQGQKLADRFNAFTYWILTKVMDSHNVGRGRESAEKALAGIKAQALVIGIDSDLLFPVSEQRFLAKAMPHAKTEIMSSIYGHDGFLVEFEQLNSILKNYYREKITVLS